MPLSQAVQEGKSSGRVVTSGAPSRRSVERGRDGRVVRVTFTREVPECREHIAKSDPEKDPLGLYIDGLQPAGIVAPDGTDAIDFWRIERRTEE